MKCKNCGQELSDDMKFCTNCGCPVEKTIQPAAFILSTTNSIPTYKIIDCYGAISASSTTLTNTMNNSVVALGDAISNFSSIFKGGDTNKVQNQIYESCYQDINERLIDKAQQNGCNAIIGLRYHSQTMNDYFYLTAYGTACVVEKEK